MSTVIVSPRVAAAARVRSENPIDLLTAAGLFPRGERWRSVSVRTIVRWIVCGKGGVHLDAVRIRGRWHTSVAAMARFVEATKAL